MVSPQVWIWTLPVTEMSSLPWSRLEAVLDPSESVRGERFKSPLDRQTYVAAHAVGRFLLSFILGGDPGQWRFQTDDRGKPEVVWQKTAPRPRLNLSHTRGVVAAALSLDHDVGVDVESLGRKVDGLALAKRFFSAAEYQMLRHADPLVRGRDFLSVWTLKEAVVKAAGTGMARQMSAFTVRLDPPAIIFENDDGDPAQWLLRQWLLESGHVMALALRHPEPAQVTVEYRPLTDKDLLSRS